MSCRSPLGQFLLVELRDDLLAVLGERVVLSIVLEIDRELIHTQRLQLVESCEVILDGELRTVQPLENLDHRRRVTPIIDPGALLDRIAGLPVSEAQAILDALGTATVNVWPGFLGDLPNDRQRITLDVLEASAME